MLGGYASQALSMAGAVLCPNALHPPTVESLLMLMTSPYESPPYDAPQSITVRAATGQLRVVSVWQAFGQSAAQAQRTIVHCKKNKDLEEMTVTFASISLAELTEIISRLNALTWVSAASLRVTTGGTFLERGRS
jgi:hypothetical protein